MLLTRRDPRTHWDELHRFRNEMSRLFDSLGERQNGPAGFPALNVWHDDASVTVESELPGMELNELEIHVTGNDQLAIKGERKEPRFGRVLWHRQERGFGSFTRVDKLPVPVDAERVQAKLSTGVLTITCPKAAAAKPKKISVLAG